MANSATFWKKKILALLHDPLTKALDIYNHEIFARQFAQAARAIHDRGPEDHIASAFDRVPLPLERTLGQVRISESEFYYIHPLSGESIGLPKVQLDSLNKKITEQISELRELNEDDEKFYHALWWEIANFSNLSHVLPADTRIPNHSILDHIDLTAAVRATEDDAGNLSPALLGFQIGPVQEIIAQARKVIDLWAGSYLLSLLIYKAIERVGLSFGFDAIIYPYLRGNPFVYDTLTRSGVKLLTSPTIDKKVASLPNIFLALVPIDKAQRIAEECKQAVIDEWMRLVNETKRLLESDTACKIHELHNFEEFLEQANLFPSINYSFIRLPSNQEDAMNVVKTYFTDSEFISEMQSFLSLLSEVKRQGGYTPNEGSFYKFIYKVLTAQLAAQKAIRSFKGYVSDSTVGSERVPDAFGGGVRACVIVLDKPKDAETEEPKKDYLGTVNTVKRFLNRLLGLGVRYESTEDVALMNDVNLTESGEQKLRNGYIGVLVMDGDNMGKWVSGEFALEASKVLHEKARKSFENAELKELLNMKVFTPAYQRNLSRTLALFSALVKYVVEDKYKGMLVYAGGDDVLAILPADKVIPCANDIRKMYVGDGLELTVDGTSYKFEKGFVYKDGVLYAPMMGSATMSAGIAIANHKLPLQMTINLAREAERYAKYKLGKNAFAISVVRRSGQRELFGSKWEADGLDAIGTAYEITELAERLNLSSRGLYKLQAEDLTVVGKENIEKLVSYLLRRSEVKKKPEHTYNDLKTKLIAYLTSLYDQDPNEKLMPIKLLLTIRLTKRGDER
ncbi:type III-B CRISPR-associated protein Cas10/Cmr2 [Fervidobacterium thailandense]|uniref:GGDEF domain-containing protein n=1 Tax=Fervidobacterium thailandense TaxID=1008305 RepID=A0A1E3G3B8_9BACT|nr:type III-B CRISPR-associated protein Cas10/Cmr2 [Fervidobacterium thailandense]ODN30765.1 hypothetical protein A4H02_04360 [Fervidobacterium thailandense]